LDGGGYAVGTARSPRLLTLALPPSKPVRPVLPLLNQAVRQLGLRWYENHIERLMLTTTGAALQIDASHARAICDEIGDRLRDVLHRQVSNELPPRLRYLMEQLAKAEDEESPSIIPSLDEMIVQKEPLAVTRRSLQREDAISSR